MAITKEQILHLLATDKRAVARALLVLYERQTRDEQASESTQHSNNRGFNSAHARRGTSMAKFFLERGYLTERQIAWWRGPYGENATRIGIYWRQLQEAAEEKTCKQM